MNQDRAAEPPSRRAGTEVRRGSADAASAARRRIGVIPGPAGAAGVCAGVSASTRSGMAESTRETERTYTAPAASADAADWLAGLAATAPRASLADEGTHDLDAVYYDTDDLRLTRGRATLRRRTGGADAGWHLKLPLPGDSREEIRAPLHDELPDELRELALSRTRGARLRPVVRIASHRSVHRLLDAHGRPLAEIALDRVSADPLRGGGRRARWSELEVELAEGADPALLDRVDRALAAHGVRRSAQGSKLVRALAETGAAGAAPHRSDDGGNDSGNDSGGSGAGDLVARYLREQVRTLLELDPDVRRDRPDAVHRMRVACRRLRSCLRSYRHLFDRRAVAPLLGELKWLAAELGVARDHEVLARRLSSALRELPTELVLGRTPGRFEAWEVAEGLRARQRVHAALRTPRYLALLDALGTLADRPPLRSKATTAGRGKAAKPGKAAKSGKHGAVVAPDKAAAKALRKVLAKDAERVRRRVEHAGRLRPGAERDAAVHQARKAAKRLRYAAEAARPALGKEAKRLARQAKAVQQISGAQHDAVVAQSQLHALAQSAQAAGEPAFTWGLLYGQERSAAHARDAELPPVAATLASGRRASRSRSRS